MQAEHRVTGAVLVIDDDPDMRTVLRDFLERAGYRVLEAANGADGVFLVQCEEVGVVILDKEMPGIDGLDVLSILARRFPSLHVILITAFGGPHVAEEARRRGALLYVEKPFRVATIVQTVQRLLQRAH